MIQLIVGLGNPGSQYDVTRHNVGADFLDYIARQCHVVLKPEKKFYGDYARALIGQHDVHLLKPTTFMNLSGQAVLAVANFFKILPSHILVVHDELDLPPGIVRLKQGGGHGGHNGLRDIITRLGGNKDFYRLRLGIGHPGSANQVVSFVLKKAPNTERQLTKDAMEQSAKLLSEIVEGNWQLVMNQLHSYKASN